MERNQLNATIKDRIDITSGLVLLYIERGSDFSDFLPGQYTTIALPGAAPRPAHFPAEKEVPKADKLIKRAYSIGSSPDEKNFIELCIAILPEGLLTSRLALLKQGDPVFLSPKVVGHFTLEPVSADRNLIFVATGTGIAPFMSMLRTKSTWTAGRKITILHGVRYKADLCYRNELLELAQNNPNFKYHAVVSRDQAEAGIEKGYVQSLFENGVVSCQADRDNIFICGNPAMIDDMEKLLLTKNYSVWSKKNPAGSLHLEKYW